MINSAVAESVDEGGLLWACSSLGNAGFAVYGPYQELEPGRYVAAFTIQMDEEHGGLADRVCAATDVVSHYGGLCYGRAEVLGQQVAGRRATIALGFEVREPAQFEFRVWVSGEASLLIGDHVDVLRLTAPRLDARPSRSRFPSLDRGPVPQELLSREKEFRRLYERGVDFEIEGTRLLATAGGKTVDATDGNIIRIAEELWRYGFKLEVNYADVREDVILLQALAGVSRDDGFYIDVGANDPVASSVTKLFYDRGWRGINIDASPVWYDRLVSGRPRDVNLHVAVSDIPGDITFFDDISSGLGTANPSFAERNLADHGVETRRIAVPTRTLTDICEEHAPRDIHFLKVDVEGHEGPVLRSMDFQRFRPWILCIEATEPLRTEAKTFQDWDRLLVEADYLLAFADHLNRYYVARERRDLRDRFAIIPDSQVKYGWSVEPSI